MQNHIVLVLAGAAAHFAAGWALNCDMLLGKLGKQDKEKKSCGFHKDMRINMALQLLASVVLTIATVAAMVIFEKAQTPSMISDMLARVSGMFFEQNNMPGMMNALHTSLFIWAGFIVPTSAGEVIWCGHHWRSWAREMVCELLQLEAVAVTVALMA